MPERVPITRGRKASSRSIPYGFCKLVIEHALADYAHAYGFGYAALRYFNAAGASPEGDLGEDHDPESHLIPIVLAVALGQRPEITIFGDDYPTPDGTCIRDYIHVDDLGAAHVLALDRLKSGQGLQLNLGTGRGYSVREVIDACRRITGQPIPERDRRSAGRAIRPSWWPTRPGPKGPLLAAQVQRHRFDRRHRLALALGPSPRIRRLTRDRLLVLPCRRPIGSASWLAAVQAVLAAPAIA